MEIRDSLTLDASGLSLTRDGFLVGDARISRAGNVQQYMGYEIGMTGDQANLVFGVYRDPDVVFDERSMLSLAGRPVTRGHPQVGVSSDNWKDLAIGQVGGIIRRDGEHVVAPMAIMDAAAAKEVMGGARSLSAGYTVQIVTDEGVAPDGTPYQFRQSGELRFNHVAYLPDNNPRAGNTRIGDNAGGTDAGIDRARWGATPVFDGKAPNMADAIQTRVVLIDGLSVVTTDAGAQALEKLTKTIEAKDAALVDANDKHKAALDAKDAVMAAKDAEIAKLKADKLSDADIDARVTARADLLGRAKAVAKDVVTKGLSDAEVRRAAVVAVLGDAVVADKSDAYIEARFDMMADDAVKGDPIAKIKLDGKAPEGLHAVYTARDADLSNAWKQEKKGV